MTLDNMIVGVAIKVREHVFTQQRAKRHDDLEHYYSEDREFRYGEKIYGFKTFDGKFLDRREAYKIAKENGQMIPRKKDDFRPEELYSTDLW